MPSTSLTWSRSSASTLDPRLSNSAIAAHQIAINAGEDGSVIIGKILEKDQYSYGFDSQTGEYVNLIQASSTPTKVVRVAIQNAASVAAPLITTEAMVAELPKKNQGGGGMPPGGGGMGGMGGMDFGFKSTRSAKH